MHYVIVSAKSTSYFAYREFASEVIAETFDITNIPTNDESCFASIKFQSIQNLMTNFLGLFNTDFFFNGNAN